MTREADRISGCYRDGKSLTAMSNLLSFELPPHIHLLFFGFRGHQGAVCGQAVDHTPLGPRTI